MHNISSFIELKILDQTSIKNMKEEEDDEEDEFCGYISSLMYPKKSLLNQVFGTSYPWDCKSLEC